MTPKPPTPQAVSALLREARFAAAGGHYRDAKGYRATWADAWATGFLTSVRVQFCATDDGTSRELLASAALVLTAYGWTVETDTRIPCLIVTAGKAEQ